ncbi:MAG: hypothetical protein ACR2QQ_04310 [Gammaproteobacteria bacterium]
MRFTWTKDRRRQRLAGVYAASGLTLAATGAWLGDVSWLLLWPAESLTLVAVCYAFLGPQGFMKSAHGRMNVAARWLLAPYLIGAWINSRLWTRNDALPAHVIDQVWIGRFPGMVDLGDCGTLGVVDLTAEFPALDADHPWHCVPMLDLVAPSVAALREASTQIDQCLREGPVLVCCALGYGRSAAAIVTWLLLTGRASTVDGAAALVKGARPRLVLRPDDLEAIATAANSENHFAVAA